VIEANDEAQAAAGCWRTPGELMIHDLHLAIRFKTAVTGWFETETHLPQQVAVLVDAYTHSDYALLGQEVGLVIQAVNLCGLLAGPGFDCGRRHGACRCIGPGGRGPRSDEQDGRKQQGDEGCFHSL